VPEGDTIYRTATMLRRALAGKPLERFETPRLPVRGPEPGTPVRSVEARGKHLLIAFGDGRMLHTHMRMSGSWHVYRPGERWWKSRAQARAILETAYAVAVCFSAPVVELLDEREVRAHPQLSALGPDLCSPEADLDEAVRRMDLLPPETQIGIALLDQRVACGVGNVYKSETLFAGRIDPFARIADLDASRRRALLAKASELLRRNLDGGPRVTWEGGLAVYDRAGRPCPRCGAGVRSERQGEDARTTYWCASCQQSRSEEAAS
jgi:endonuclease VIII